MATTWTISQKAAMSPSSRASDNRRCRQGSTPSPVRGVRPVCSPNKPSIGPGSSRGRRALPATYGKRSCPAERQGRTARRAVRRRLPCWACSPGRCGRPTARGETSALDRRTDGGHRRGPAGPASSERAEASSDGRSGPHRTIRIAQISSSSDCFFASNSSSVMTPSRCSCANRASRSVGSACVGDSSLIPLRASRVRYNSD